MRKKDVLFNCGYDMALTEMEVKEMIKRGDDIKNPEMWGKYIEAVVEMKRFLKEIEKPEVCAKMTMGKMENGFFSRLMRKDEIRDKITDQYKVVFLGVNVEM